MKYFHETIDRSAPSFHDGGAPYDASIVRLSGVVGNRTNGSCCHVNRDKHARELVAENSRPSKPLDLVREELRARRCRLSTEECDVLRILRSVRFDYFRSTADMGEVKYLGRSLRGVFHRSECQTYLYELSSLTTLGQKGLAHCSWSHPKCLILTETGGSASRADRSIRC